MKKLEYYSEWKTLSRTLLSKESTAKNEKGIIAEAVSIDKVVQNKGGEYAVIIDRISQDVPFYRAYLKNAALNRKPTSSTTHFGGALMINSSTIVWRIL